MVGNIIYGGISAKDYGAIITYSGFDGTAERDCETVEIPGKNGNLIKDNKRYKNIDVDIRLFIYNKLALAAYRSDLFEMIGYNRLESSDYPEEYRLARIKGKFSPDMLGIKNNHGEVTITFECKPQRFLKSGEYPVTFTKSDLIINPTKMPAKPLMRVYGSGELSIGSQRIVIKGHGSDYIDIDCELQDGFYQAQNMNDYIEVQDEFPELPAGMTDIILGAGISKLVIYPRWWRL